MTETLHAFRWLFVGAVVLGAVIIRLARAIEGGRR
jgi:hypothetical protein